MKRYLQCLPLLALAPLAHFLGFYLAGRGVIDAGLGMFIGAIGLYPLILAVALVFGFVASSSSNFVRYSSCMVAIVAQFVLVFTLPGGAGAEVMGVAHQLKREFPITQVRECANHLLEKYRARTLTSADTEKPKKYLWSDSVFAVDNSELPVGLRGRFRWVQIRRVRLGFSEDLQVFFCIDPGRSIICDSRPFVSDVSEHSIEEGVHAYHAQRS